MHACESEVFALMYTYVEVQAKYQESSTISLLLITAKHEALLFLARQEDQQALRICLSLLTSRVTGLHTCPVIPSCLSLFSVSDKQHNQKQFEEGIVISSYSSILQSIIEGIEGRN